MTSEYSRSVLRMVVAQICQTIGWHSINTTPLEFMVDLMQEYLLRIAKLSHQYAEVLGRTEANLDDVGLTFQHMNIDVQELMEYVKNIDSVPCPVTVPKYPIHRENHLNFLKPGSREVVTRPVHVHEHLPAMYPNTEEEYPVEKSENVSNNSSEVGSSNGVTTGNSLDSSPHRLSPQGVFKRPGDPISFESPMVKRVKLLEEGRPLREIHSVMMTTSGFLSPAREGKLPEARTPHQTRSDSPQPTSYPMVPPELKSDKKPKKVVKKVPEDRKLDKENKKKIRAKELLFTPDKIDESKIKKLAGMKELAKLKPLKPGGGKSQCNSAGPSSRPSTPKLVSPKPAGSPKQPKVVQPKTKMDKVIDLTANSPPTTEKKEENVDKLPSEPDKQKLNIFKKISKPREEKDKDLPEPLKHKDLLDSRENSPSLIIDENNEKHPIRGGEPEKKEEKKNTPHTPDVTPQPDPEIIDLQSPSSDVYMFDDMSPPGTPSTPKTPELNVPNPADQKKKKKEKVNKKKEPKLRSPKQCVSPKKSKISNDTTELDILDRPKTPQAPEPPPQIHRDPPVNLPPPPPLPFPFFPTFHPGPGLIPHPIGHPMFPRLPLPLPRGGPSPHPAMPNLPIPPRFLPPTMKPEDFPLPKPKILDRDKPLLPPPMDLIISPVIKSDKLEKERPVKMVKHDKELSIQPVGSNMVPPPMTVPVSLAPSPAQLSSPTSAPTIVPVPPSVPIPVIPPPSLPPPKPPKVDKMDKIDKKTKEHKKEKKDKLKKKKDKKEKHKEKGEKLKEKKEKAEKKEKLEKIKEKKEKKDKKKEKEPKDDKNAEGVPKITLKLGPSSPRPPTPDNTPMKKITIKTLLKKPLEETKREPSPELAKISALVTRPPKQKLASKKTEEGALDGGGLILSADTSFSTNLNSVSLVTAPRTKKSLFKALPSQTEPSQIIPNCDQPPKYPDPSMVQQPPAYYFDQEGHQVWICPACGNQDDGTPMIGCDDCDAWYHWVCVGMQVPPAANEDWYCRFCISKKQELHHDKKKKKRKKKVKMTA